MIKIGTSGFSYADWKGVIYPKDVSSENMLTFYERGLGFNTVEVNYTFYRPPSESISSKWVKDVSGQFEFVFRSHREMTHDIWMDSKRMNFKDNKKIFKQFLEGIKPIHKEGKLGCILIQFPTFFMPHSKNFQYILQCKERLSPIPLVIEFRNKAWLKESTFTFLKKIQVGYCTVDEPKLSPLLPLVPETTSNISYLRLHGRNPKWFNSSKEERYNYLYSKEELQTFIPVIKQLGKPSEKSYIFFNNCHGGFAVRNALILKEMLGLQEGSEKGKGGSQ